MYADLKRALNFRNSETIHQALSSSLIIAQCFGVMPICGVTNPDYLKLKFDYSSFRFVYAVVQMSLVLANTAFFVAQGVSIAKISLWNTVNVLFYWCMFLASSYFMVLATKWQEIMKNWCHIDRKMAAGYGFPNGLRAKFIFMTASIMGGAILEHALFISHNVVNSAEEVAVDVYFQHAFDQIFRFVPYSLITACTFQTSAILATMTWNYMDLFIMLVSSAVASRFAQVNERIEKAVENKIEDVFYWMQIRDDYNSLNLLSKMLDKALANIVLLSYAHNIFIILVQLLHSLDKEVEKGLINRMYFLYSFGFLILRTFAVSLYASKVHSESVKSQHTLHELPSEIYNVEVDRLMIQIKMDPSSFSGRGFFKVKKSVVLSIAGAIVTYELYFVQFAHHL